MAFFLALTMIRMLILCSIHCLLPKTILLQFSYKTTDRANNKLWLITDIKISCQCKRDLYLLSGSSTNLKWYYKFYCKILNNVIRQAKRTWYNKQILTSNNVTKTTWTVIKTEIGKKDTNEDFYWFNNDANNSLDYQSISDSVSTYFLSITEKITKNITNDNNINCNKERTPLHSLFQSYSNIYPNMKFNHTSTK